MVAVGLALPIAARRAGLPGESSVPGRRGFVPRPGRGRGRGRRRRFEADSRVAAGQRVGRVDGVVACLAQEGVVGGAVPSRSLSYTTIAGSGGFSTHRAGQLFVRNH